MVDAHSLGVVAKELEDKQVPTITPRQLVDTPGGPWLANIIQTVVLHDTIVVDSVLFDLNEISQAYKLFPDVIKGVFIRDSVRRLIGDRVEAAVPTSIDRPLSMSNQDWNRWMWLDSSEKPLMDKIHENAPRLIPPEYAGDVEITRALDRSDPVWIGIPGHLLNSYMTVGRAHFYLELARELRTPLNIDPVRSSYLHSMFQKQGDTLNRSLPEQILDFFTAKITTEDPDFPFVFDVDIPPVAEHVLRYAQDIQVSLHTATLEVRQSRNAREFRDWCARLFTLREEGSAKDVGEYKKMKEDFKKACEAWAADLGEGVDFQRRKLTLGDIPIMGWILKAAGMDEPVVKDPVVSPKSSYRYFLFLNDLLRQPQKSAV